MFLSVRKPGGAGAQILPSLAGARSMKTWSQEMGTKSDSESKGSLERCIVRPRRQNKSILAQSLSYKISRDFRASNCLFKNRRFFSGTECRDVTQSPLPRSGTNSADGQKIRSANRKPVR